MRHVGVDMILKVQVLLDETSEPRDSNRCYPTGGTLSAFMGMAFSAAMHRLHATNTYCVIVAVTKRHITRFNV